MGAGLGGGSLRRRNGFDGLKSPLANGLISKRLATIKLHLGADVPVFIFGQNAFGQGIGEAVANGCARSWYLLLSPKIHVPTPSILATLI